MTDRAACLTTWALAAGSWLVIIWFALWLMGCTPEPCVAGVLVNATVICQEQSNRSH